MAAIREERPSKDASQKDRAAWDKANHEVFYALSMCVVGNVTAVNITEKHVEKMVKFTEEGEPELYMDDGRGAYTEIKELCVGKDGAENFESLLMKLLGLPHFGDDQVSGVQQMLAAHVGIVRKMQACTKPENLMDVICKCHLLRKVRSFEKYAAVEEAAAQKTVSYDAAVELIQSRNFRLSTDQLNPDHVDPAEAAAMRVKGWKGGRGREESERREDRTPGTCFNCGKKGHFQADCPEGLAKVVKELAAEMKEMKGLLKESAKLSVEDQHAAALHKRDVAAAAQVARWTQAVDWDGRPCPDEGYPAFASDDD